MTELQQASFDAYDEAERANSNWPLYNSAHEGLGLLMEEFKELKEIIYLKPAARDLAAMRREAIQVAAVALRFASECCDETVGRR